MKKILALLLAVVMVLSLAACGTAGDKPTDPPAPVTYVDPYANIEDYNEKSSAIYDDVLGDFYTAYEAAKAATNVSERYALMAVAEAKLMEAAVMLPLSSNGGNYAISRVAPYTAPNALWGNDSYRYHNVVVADKFITGADRAEMKAKWAELKGTGTYEAWAKSFLEGKGYTLLETQYGEGDAAKSQTIAENYITQGVVGIFGCNEGSTNGAGNAVKAAGSATVVVGFDKSDAIMGLIEDGFILATMAQNPDVMGYEGVKAAVAALKGEALGGAVTDTGVSVLTK